MYITTAGGIDLAAATGPGSRYRQDKRCQQWEELMDADFHGYILFRSLSLKPCFHPRQYLLIKCRHKIMLVMKSVSLIRMAPRVSGWTAMEEIHSSDVQWNQALGAKYAESTHGASPAAASEAPRTSVSPTSPVRLNRDATAGGQHWNHLSRYEADNMPPKSPGTGRRGAVPAGGQSQIQFG